MNFSKLIEQREKLLREARLANLAFAYRELHSFAQRVARANLRGEVELREAAPESETHWATLTAIEGSQSVIEEHFTDEDIVELTDLIAYATDADDVCELFRIEDLHRHFAEPLRRELEQAGVEVPANDDGALPGAASSEIGDRGAGLE